MSTLLEQFGLDPRDLDWRDLAACRALPIEDFIPDEEHPDRPGHPMFEGYESDPVIASIVDEMCESCPVLKMCGKYGKDNEEEGVYAGAYLVGGRVADAKNSHKTDEELKESKRFFKGL